MNKRTYYVGVILSLLVVGYVLLKLDWSQVGNTFLRLRWIWVILGFIVYLVNYWLRTIRFRTLLALEEIPFLQLLGVTNLYGMYLYLMPAKFGEVTFPVLLKRRLGTDLSTSTGSLIVARVFDFFTIALILPFILFIYWQIMP
ncbi:MAG: flippase-like domain-containing protein, partial [Candidatus Heimdallarchaeota archaeon]|nr:flippase-like domain-containing protein [Candidatus Heimdallarchaeota archaeon]